MTRFGLARPEEAASDATRGPGVLVSADSHVKGDSWFNEVVKSHLPPDTPEPKFTELHNSNTK